VNIAANFTVAEFLAHETFKKRMEEQRPLYIHEFIYALMQAYDAYHMKTDVQVGGIDQLFNILAGRKLQQAKNEPPLIAVCTPLLAGTDGHLKMSKSVGNSISMDEAPAEMYGKLMSIPDSLMVNYYTLLTEVPVEEVAALERGLAERSVNPMDTKKRLAHSIVALLNDESAADAAQAEFERVFQRREEPEENVIEVGFTKKDWEGLRAQSLESQSELARQGNLGERLKTLSDEHRAEVFPVSSGMGEDDDDLSHRVSIPQLLVFMKLASSRSEARRLVEQGAVVIDGNVVTSVVGRVTNQSLIKVGRHRFGRIVDADPSG